MNNWSIVVFIYIWFVNIESYVYVKSEQKEKNSNSKIWKRKMKVICAGFPKTGSKSCSTALRQLGYNVADYMETAEFLRQVSV